MICPVCHKKPEPQTSTLNNETTGPVLRRYYVCEPNKQHPDFEVRIPTAERISGAIERVPKKAKDSYSKIS